MLHDTATHLSAGTVADDDELPSDFCHCVGYLGFGMASEMRTERDVVERFRAESE